MLISWRPPSSSENNSFGQQQYLQSWIGTATRPGLINWVGDTFSRALICSCLSLFLGLAVTVPACLLGLDMDQRQIERHKCNQNLITLHWLLQIYWIILLLRPLKLVVQEWWLPTKLRGLTRRVVIKMWRKVVERCTDWTVEPALHWADIYESPSPWQIGELYYIPLRIAAAQVARGARLLSGLDQLTEQGKGGVGRKAREVLRERFVCNFLFLCN